ncbi:MAG: GAF domain-containing protein [Polyangiaceae bacterium]
MQGEDEDLLVMLREQGARFHKLLGIQRRLGSERNLDRLLPLVMSEVSELLEGDRCSVFLFDPDQCCLRARYASGLEQELVLPLRLGIVGTVLLTRSPSNIANAYDHPHFNPHIDGSTGFKTGSTLVVPLLDQGEAVGAVQLLNKRTGRFLANDVQLAAETASELVLALQAGTLDEATAAAAVAALRRDTLAERGSVFVLERRRQRLSALYTDGVARDSLNLDLNLGIAGWVAVTGETANVADVSQDSRFNPEVDQRTGYRTRSLLCAPILGARGEALGVVQVINKHYGSFSEDDREALEAVMSVISVAIENALLLADQNRQFHSLLEVLAASIDARDSLTAGHSFRVAAYAVGIGRDLGFAGEELKLLEIAALLHDYGKIGTDDQVLKKNGKLTPEEYAHIQQHPALTFSILERIHFARPYRDVPLIAASTTNAWTAAAIPGA